MKASRSVGGLVGRGQRRRRRGLRSGRNGRRGSDEDHELQGGLAADGQGGEGQVEGDVSSGVVDSIRSQAPGH